jgi:hypothetical protein
LHFFREKPLRISVASLSGVVIEFNRKERHMLSRTISLPELGLIAGTRMAMGVGVGLLIADQFTSNRRRTVGWLFLTVGALTTIPLAADVLLRRRVGDNGSHGPESEEREMATMHDT